jgi:hypothetical protein
MERLDDILRDLSEPLTMQDRVFRAEREISQLKIGMQALKEIIKNLTKEKA